ncbi:MAG: hypothetical protein IJ154_03590 [Bacteroidales bacterium]|nr:hypothetical protein [Bacteroidales bacterium]
MKYTKWLVATLAVSLFVLGFSSCQSEKSVDCSEEDLVGLWYNDASPREYWRYYPDGSGYTWNEDDDVYENEAQAFEWVLDKNRLTQFHIIAISGTKIPKSYTITEISHTSMEYKDSYKRFSFTRVE